MAIYLSHQHTRRLLVELELAAERLVLQVLDLDGQDRLPLVMAVLNIFEEELDLLHRDDITDVVGPGELAEDNADHLAINHDWATTVTRVDRRVDLDAQSLSPQVDILRIRFAKRSRE